jgi:cell division protein FtsL
LLPLTLALFVILSALAVVQVKHKHRTLTTKLETLRTERERLELEWAQLQLEEATLAQHGRVDTLARSQFDMVDPRDYRIVDSTGAAATPPAAVKP